MLRITHPNGAIEWRRIPADWYVIGRPRYIPISVKATAAHATALLATTIANRVAISPAGSMSFTTLGTDVTAGYDLGSFTVGQKKDYILRVLVPALTDTREEFYELKIGEGT